MTKLIDSIINKNFVECDSILSETVELIMARKLEEAKKLTAAKMCEEPHSMNRSASKLRSMDIAEEEVDESIDPEEIHNGPAPKGQRVNQVGKGDKEQPNTTVVPKNNLKEEELEEKRGLWDNIHAKRERIKRGSGERMRKPGSEGAPSNTDLKNSQTEEAELEENYHPSYTSAIQTAVKHAEKRGYKVDPEDYDNKVATGPRKPSEGKTVSHVLKLTKDGKESKKTLAVQIYNRGGNKTPFELNHYISEDVDNIDEARINIVKARIRGGQIQRRKKISNVPGMTLRGGKLQRMSAAERRRRKMGARKAVRKRAPKMNRALMKRQRSLRKRKALGI